jgi:hypothetical protein
MKKIFTLAIALMSLLATTKAATAVFNVTVPNPTYQCWIVGNFNGWNNNLTQCTKVDATHYTVTLDEANFSSGVTLANIEYKYLSGGGDWAYVEKDAAGTELNNRTYVKGTTVANPDPAKATIPGNDGNDVVQKWAATYNPTVLPLPMKVTIDVLVSDSTFECYIVGTFNNWAGPTAPVDSCKMTLISTDPVSHTKIFEKTIYTPDANKLAYHFCCGPDWSFEQLAPSGDYKYPEVAPVVTAWKKIYDPSKVGNIVVTATVPTGTTDVWVNGSFIGWNFDGKGAGGQKCTKNLDGTFSFTAPLVLSIEYKMYNGQSWNNVEVDATGVEVKNRTASFPADATKAITVVGWKTPAAVQQLNMDNYKVYSNNNKIVVEGVVSAVELFNLDGRRVQSEKLSGTFKSQNLSSGLYIIRVDGASMKVSVN